MVWVLHARSILAVNVQEGSRVVGFEEGSRKGRSLSCRQANSCRAAQRPATQERGDRTVAGLSPLKGFPVVGAVRGVRMEGVAGRSSLGPSQPVGCPGAA